MPFLIQLKYYRRHLITTFNLVKCQLKENSLQFNNPNDDEITVSIESHVMNLKVTRKSSQSYIMKQQPSVHIKLPGRHGISSPFSIGRNL